MGFGGGSDGWECGQQHAATQIQSLRHQIRKQDKKQEVRMQEVRALIQDQLKEQIVRDMQWVPIRCCVPSGYNVWFVTCARG